MTLGRLLRSTVRCVTTCIRDEPLFCANSIGGAAFYASAAVAGSARLARRFSTLREISSLRSVCVMIAGASSIAPNNTGRAVLGSSARRALLVALGWYLVCVPNGRCFWGVEGLFALLGKPAPVCAGAPNYGAPISEWIHSGDFDRIAECHEAMEQSSGQCRCVATDDPRLKGD